MKAWINKLMDGLEFDWKDNKDGEPVGDHPQITEELATILYVIDHYNKYLFEIEKHPIRKTRQEFDEYAKMIVRGNENNRERALFNFRKFFSSYRIDEVSYIQQTFDDFKTIIWDFVDQLGEEFRHAEAEDNDVKASFDQLKEAVEADSIDDLRNHSRNFIDCFIEYQTRQESSNKKRLHKMKKNLDVVREKLVEANDSMRRDHLTGAFNRKSFDEKMEEHWRMYQMEPKPLSLLMMDIDYFKKINDNYGHPVGDFVLQECVKIIQDHFSDKNQFVSRIGGEEFSVILPKLESRDAEKLVNSLQDKIRKEVFIDGEHRIQFTISVGIAEICHDESIEEWMKRADDALYESKNTGRDKYTISPRLRVKSVAS
ncbi:MAG: GGDEF domain-containing protein [Bdellovibrionota bacterium]|nr:GGDEF domain-containing protein [Bdellovibrionota bacterium]